MYSSVPTIAPNWVNSDRSVSLWPVALATPKSMTLGRRLAVDERDHHIRRLDIPVDDPLLVGMLDRPADRHEQLQSPSRG